MAEQEAEGAAEQQRGGGKQSTTASRPAGGSRGPALAGGPAGSMVTGFPKPVAPWGSQVRSQTVAGGDHHQ